ncbi:hypothetical protein GGR54DRAFT_457736 [Hypoxylon sp. NC1633]|nr:hypothetical protein GGR54DRAFT_457736 [Hypoxylon sp. NC1633]
MSAKSVATSFINSISRRDFDQLPTYFSDDAIWWVNGNPSRNPHAGDSKPANRLPMMPRVLSRFEKYSLDIVNIVGESNKAIAEVKAQGAGPLDLVYTNHIMMSFEVNEEGKIKSLREFPDFDELKWLLQWFQDHDSSNNKA